jgi:hypothetical protein
MNLSTILDVALGMVLIYYILSLIVSYITGEIAKWTEMRAKDLEHVLRERLKHPETFEKLMNHPLVTNLKPIRVKLFGTGKWDSKVAAIPASTFSTTLFDILAPESDEDNKLEKLKSAIKGMPESDMRTSLSSVVGQTVEDIQTARENVEKWYDDIVQNVSQLYTQHVRRIAIICALLVSIAVDADSIAIVNQLWSQPTLRAAAETKAQDFVNQAPDPQQANVASYVASLQELKIPILWAVPLPQDTQGWLLRILGWLITWVAIAQGSSFWYDVLKRVRSTVSGGGAAQPAKT